MPLVAKFILEWYIAAFCRVDIDFNVQKQIHWNHLYGFTFNEIDQNSNRCNREILIHLKFLSLQAGVH